MSEKEKVKMMDRRNFMKATTAGAGVLAFSGLVPNSLEAKITDVKWDMSADVVVLGAGGAGLFASIEAAAAGAKVIMLESTAKVGGSSAICGGSLVFAGTDFQKEKKVNDSNKLLYDDFMEIGKHRNVPELVQTYADNQLDTYDRLKKLGVKFTRLLQGEGSVPRTHRVNPLELIQILKKEVDRLGVKTLMETPATRLVRDSSGRIIGVMAAQGSKIMNIEAKKGVVVSTGGFSNNPEMLDDLRIGFSRVRSAAAEGSRGDGVKMLWNEGARMKDLPSLKASFSTHPKSTAGRRQPVNTYRVGSILINKLGKRFVNESLGHKELPEFTLMQPDGVVYELFDAKIAPEAAAKSMMIREEDLDQWAIKASTLDELATKAGIPAAALKETVARYNKFVDDGKDQEFGRKYLFGGGESKLIKIDTPPFYFVEGVAAILGTYCGAQVNSRAEVLNVYGEPIPGLFAAGEVMGGMHGDGYIGGTAFGKALIFGRLAGKTAAAQKG